MAGCPSQWIAAVALWVTTAAVAQPLPPAAPNRLAVVPAAPTHAVALPSSDIGASRLPLPPVGATPRDSASAGGEPVLGQAPTSQPSGGGGPASSSSGGVEQTPLGGRTAPGRSNTPGADNRPGASGWWQTIGAMGLVLGLIFGLRFAAAPLCAYQGGCQAVRRGGTAGANGLVSQAPDHASSGWTTTAGHWGRQRQLEHLDGDHRPSAGIAGDG